jgi:hypothetical protein
MRCIFLFFLIFIYTVSSTTINDTNLMNNQNNSLNITEIKSDILNIKSELSTLMSEIKSDITNIKSELSTFKSEIKIIFENDAKLKKEEVIDISINKNYITVDDLTFYLVFIIVIFVIFNN